MSTLLHAIGLWATRARWLVLAMWIAILAVLGIAAGLFSQGANAPITIPGTESQEAIDTLGRTFPEVSGTSATIIVVAPEGARADEPRTRQAVAAAVDELEQLDHVSAVASPFAEQGASDLSDDGRAALLTIQITDSQSDVPEATTDGIIETTERLQDRLPQGTQVSYGGDVFSVSIPGFTATEAIGVLIAFIVLLFTLGSLAAAGMPLVIAIIGVGVTIAGLFVTTAFAEMTSTTPMLALMLGLAVGIDYTLFIVSRHQEQLRSGLGITESIARATATSGSAVVFAGLTVIIALLGLAVAGIPFLTALGVAAAAGVAVAVLIGVTLTPAILAMAGLKILPRRQRAALAAGDAVEAPASAPARATSRADRFFGGWVRAVTAKPVATILAVLVVLGVAAIPMTQLRLALPGAETLEATDPARITYELTGEHFGEGANGPLLLTGSIITSDDPVGLMEDLADEVRGIPGVHDVPLATPNQNADTGIIQVVPEEGPQAESTSELVAELRAHHDAWLDEYGVSLAVTGFTAVGIDVSHLLGEALLPFGVLVVGLSLILLAMVFRSVWVPIKATLGYLLSVGVAFGAVVAVFQWGWFGDALHVHATGPVLSFMPIILMGVLFGLAMDYEVFLVSRIREEYVHGADAQTAIRRGFVGSAKVVTAAALIMFAVFAAFVPEGDPSIKVIALGLAVGVFVDAFIVRMTLVPAVLALLGDRAWSMPRRLSRMLPVFDVEGEGLARELAHAAWPADLPDARVAADALALRPGAVSPTVRVAAGQALVLDPHELADAAPLAEALTGRRPIAGGTAKVAGLLLPERAASLRTRSAWATAETLRAALRDRPAVLVLDLRGRSGADADPGAVDDAAPAVDDARSALAAHAVDGARGAAPECTFLVLGGAEAARRLLPADTELVAPASAHGVGASAVGASGEGVPAVGAPETGTRPAEPHAASQSRDHEGSAR
ncbi:MMPL family transporter [Leucobacter chromiiresistens]|uniref:Putative drug exporter of the RND superfamily n=2 Tax=Leucobacter chromiiresistens TaxID=1079994 RepID=A0A1H0Y5I9_9MICO|nr:MMPL family transporter [Leucobacter chromiiresistens]SDQ10320.1 putative drug exporter of the RND superfamily [Leucobacter chromiiresistens]